MSTTTNRAENKPSRQFKSTHHNLVKSHDKYIVTMTQEESDQPEFPACSPDNHLMYEIYHRDVGHISEGAACCPQHGFESAWDTILAYEERLRKIRIEAKIHNDTAQNQEQMPQEPGEILTPHGWRRMNTKNRNRFQREEEDGSTSVIWPEGSTARYGKDWHYVQTDPRGRTLTTSQGKSGEKDTPTSSMESAIKICQDSLKAYRYGMGQHR